MQFHFLRKWQELSRGVRTTCRGFHLAYFHSYWWIKSVTRRPKNSHTEGKSRPCIRAFLWCDRQCTRRTGYICSVPGVEVRSIYKIFVWKNLKFFLQGTLHGPSSLPASLNMRYMNFYQPASHWEEESEHWNGRWRQERRPAHPIFRKTSAWIDCSLFKNEQRNPTEGFWKGSAT